MILFIIPTFSGGGAERASLNLLNQLHYQNYHVELVVFDDNGPLLTMVPKGVPIHNLATSTLRRSIFPLIYKIYLLRPQVIFTTLSYVNLFLIFIHFFMPMKFSLWVREANLPSISLPNNKHSYLMKLGYFWLYRHADMVLCTSLRMKNEFIRNFYVSSEKAHILPNPIDEQLIRKMSSNVMERQNNGVRFIAAGRLVYQKGFDRLLRWFTNLEDQNSNLYILGQGPMEQELIDLATKLGVSSRVFIIGFCDNPWTWYASADVFLLSSRWEGMSNAALEALACGTPVIATAESGGIAEVAKQAIAGAVIVTTTEILFQKAMSKVQEDSKNSVLRVSLLPECYRLESVADQLKKWLN
jgi:glycosyltransferase involved in cell wall biosynthesis